MMTSFTDKELEQLLAAQPLRQPSPELDRRVAAELLRPPLPLGESWGEGMNQQTLDSSLQLGGTPKEPQSHDSSALTLSPRQWGSSQWRIPLALAAGLAMAVGLLVISERKHRTANPPPAPLAKTPHAAPSPLGDFNPVRIEEVWSRLAPEGVMSFDGGGPVRRYRRQTLQHVQLIDEDRNIRIEYTVPRDDLLVMPVRFD